VLPATTELGPVIEMEVSTPGATVSANEFDVTRFNDAAMFAGTVVTPVARPVLAPMVAAPVFEEFHVTCVVMSAVELSP
jgi:hypothetical protein